MFDLKVIDIHCHLGFKGRYGVGADVDLYLKIMDLAGVDISCVNYIYSSDASRGNDIVFEWINNNPDRFVPVAFVSPFYSEEIIPELERCFDIKGCKFIKIYPDYYRKPSDDPGYFPVYEFANDRGLAVMSHTLFSFDPPGITIKDRYTALAERFPNVKWIFAHVGGGNFASSGMNVQAVDAALSIPNTYLETCMSSLSHSSIEDGVYALGADRFLYGSDIPLLDPRNQVAKIATAEISQEDKRKILGLNASKLFKL